MAFDAGSVIAKIRADVSDFKAGIDTAKGQTDSFKSKLDGLSKGLGNLGKKATAFATVPILGLGAGFVKLASDAEEINSKFDAVFKNMSGWAKGEIKEMAEALGRSETELRGYAATIQDTFVPLGFAREEAAETALGVVQLAEDLASFNNLRTADVVRDLQSALVGNTETLRKYGVVAQQAQIEQFALENSLLEADGSLTAENKAWAILQLTLQGTTDAQGDAARTSESTANQMKALTSEFKALGEELGVILIPVVLELIDTFRVLIDWFRGLDDNQKKLIIVIGLVVAAIGPLLIILSLLVSGISAVITIVGGLMTIFGLLLSPIGLVVAAIVALYLAWKTNFLGIRDITDTIIKFVLGLFGDIPGKLADIGKSIFSAMTKPFEDAWNFISDKVNKIKDALDFTKRQSPSVVDLVNKSAREVNRAMKGFDFGVAVGPKVAAVGAANGGGTTNVNQITVDLSGAIISNDAAAQEISEKIGDSIVRKLQSNLRF